MNLYNNCKKEIELQKVYSYMYNGYINLYIIL